MKLNKGASIFTVKGKEIGKLSRIVLDPKTKNISNLVFQHGLLPKEEYIIPMRLVDQVNETGIHLKKLPMNDPENLPLFREEEYIVVDESDLLDRAQSSGDTIRTYYEYPPTVLGAGNTIYPNDLTMNAPAGVDRGFAQLGMPDSVNLPISKGTQENIPNGTVAIKEGSRVYDSAEKHLGNVERIFVDMKTGRATHLIISKGLLLKERKQIPVEWITEIKENEIHLGIDRKFADNLPDYQPK